MRLLACCPAPRSRFGDRGYCHTSICKGYCAPDAALLPQARNHPNQRTKGMRHRSRRNQLCFRGTQGLFRCTPRLAHMGTEPPCTCQHRQQTTAAHSRTGEWVSRTTSSGHSYWLWGLGQPPGAHAEEKAHERPCLACCVLQRLHAPTDMTLRPELVVGCTTAVRGCWEGL